MKNNDFLSLSNGNALFFRISNGNELFFITNNDNGYALEVPHKKNRKQKTENKNFNLSEILCIPHT